MKTQVAIVGGGPAGSTAAMFLAREGILPVIVEKDAFPRYHIGESMNGECGAILRRLGLESEMLKRKHPIKHGLTVFGTNGKNSWYVPVIGRDKDWKLFNQFTWQVRRAEFDEMLLNEAKLRGAMVVSGRASKALINDDGSVRGVQVHMADGGVQNIESDLLLDCSGQATFLANTGITGPKYRGSYDKQIAIFSQVAGAIRQDPPNSGDTLIFYKGKFHWAWFIPIDDEVVSVGVVTSAAYFSNSTEDKRDFLLRELRELNPELSRRLPDLRLVEEVHVIPNYSYQVKDFCGKGFACIGDAHRFIDPIFSFGLFVSMREAELIQPAIKGYLAGKGRDLENPFAKYQLQAEKGIDILEDLIDTFWENPMAFSIFTHRRYTEEIYDIFAGRLYEHQPSEAILACRKLLQRSRVYGKSDDYSVPIGSRYHPERAAIWNNDSSMINTEEQSKGQSPAA